jgi:hypothetical protein
MQAALQSNWLNSMEATSLSSDNNAGSVRVYGDTDTMEIGVINGVRKILVPINRRIGSNDDWSKHSDFELMFDESAGVKQTWVEVIPPNRSVALPLKPRAIEAAQPNWIDQFDDSLVFLNCCDFQRTYDELIHRGATFLVAPAKLPFGWLSMFEDGDGRRYVLGQW